MLRAVRGRAGTRRRAQRVHTANEQPTMPAALLDDARRGGEPAAAVASADVIILPAAEAVALAPASLDGHAFVTCQERGPLGEVWRLRGPDGRPRLAYLLHHSLTADAGPRLPRLLGLSHPALPPLELAQGPAGQVVLLTPQPTRTLASWFRECRNIRRPGVPPAKLLDYLQQAAEALDELLCRHDLQHLNLRPDSLCLDGERV